MESQYSLIGPERANGRQVLGLYDEDWPVFMCINVRWFRYFGADSRAIALYHITRVERRGLV